MAIYHFSVKVISRANGSSALASAAYRSASRLHDARLDRAHDFSNKAGVVHSEVMLPDGAPEDWRDREKLWNAVETIEKRKDAQLAREVEFAIPREMSEAQGIDLARNFVAEHFVAHGMVADLNVHWDRSPDGLPKPHAHVMLTMREIVGPDGDEGFGAKVRDWNRTELVERWREAWAAHVNVRLAELDIDASVDHRSLEAQGIDLEPQNKLGPAASRMTSHRLELERIAEHQEIARRNGEKIIANPNLALDGITHGQSTFTRRDLAIFVHRHSDGKDQYDRVIAAVQASPTLVLLGKDGRGEDRFTSRAMLETEQRLDDAAGRLSQHHEHKVSAAALERALSTAATRGLQLGKDQRAALEHIVSKSDLALVTGYAGTGKSAMLGVARDAWEQSGQKVHGLALSGIAAENLETGSGIPSRTIAALEHQWSQDRDLLTARDIVVIDEAGMVGTRQLERILSVAKRAQAKVVLVGDPQQLQAIEAGAAFRALAERHGAIEITDIRRQTEDWQRDATRHLATGRTGEAVRDYETQGMVHAAETREAARIALIARWDSERRDYPEQSRIILTHTNEEVRALNMLARERLRAEAQLGEDVTIHAERGERTFAPGDRLMFFRNDRGLGVRNGTLGTVEQASANRLTVRLDGDRSIAFDVKDYPSFDHGYAATVHKAQGMTVDRAHILATPGLNSHSAYVAMSRHRDSLQLHYGQDDFADSARLVRTLSRERPKDMASDYVPSHETEPASAFQRSYAERRGIRFTERMREVVQKARNIFAGFRPAPALEALPSPDLETQAEHAGHRKAVERYARAIVAIDMMQEKALPTLLHQQTDLERARADVDRIRPHAVQDVDAAFHLQPVLVREAAAGRGQTAMAAMAREAEVRANPELRADRFVQRWQVLRRQQDVSEREGDTRAARIAAREMDGMAKALHRDPQMESLLRNRRHALGLGRSASGGGLSRDLTEMADFNRSRNLGLSR